MRWPRPDVASDCSWRWSEPRNRGTTSGARPRGAAFSAALVPSLPGRRKPWDLQGRLQDLQERIKSVKGEKQQLRQQSTSQLQELEKLRAELIMERRKNAALTARVSELESSLSSSEAQTVSARALSDSLLQELQYAAQQVATLGQSD
ncbi:low affinity immunoglobulin epsilon Fc receptor-like isoform X2 [Dermacentor albipictus]|uniref:low affinity immunoglobulin epsilon Fc receptor-like isoform X2 n=1 Tax=Dermacentor albipictus TaxID=60249 RepID=UPI0038FD2208